jgi:uncharacterized FlaG/YvyC family protein
MTDPDMSSVRPIETIGPTDFGSQSELRGPAVQPKATAAPKAPTPAAPARDDLATAVSAANSNLATYNRVMDFKVDSASGLSIAFIRNAQTGDVIQQIPSPDMVKLAQMLKDWSPGKNMMLDLQA